MSLVYYFFGTQCTRFPTFACTICVIVYCQLPSFITYYLTPAMAGEYYFWLPVFHFVMIVTVLVISNV